MVQTLHVEMREGEEWRDVVDSFMRYCIAEKKLGTGGCHEGNSIPVAGGRRYAAISVAEHSSFFMDYLNECCLLYTSDAADE